MRGRHNAKSLWSWDALLAYLGGNKLEVSAETVSALATKLHQTSPETRQAGAITLAQRGGAVLLTQLVGAGLQIEIGRETLSS